MPSDCLTKQPVSSLISMSMECVVRNVLLYTDFLHFLPSHIKERILQKLTKSSKHSSLAFDKILPALVHPKLKCINLSSVRVSNRTLDQLTNCPMLSNVEIKNSEAHSFSYEGLQIFFRKTKGLLVLDISKCQHFDDDVMELLANNCSNLYELSCNGCNITNRGLNFLAAKNKVIKCLSISNTKITGTGITNAVKDKNWCNLKELRLDNCLKVDNEVLKVIIQNCPKIRVLTFYNCAITDETSIFQDISETCKKLKQLHWTIKW